MALSICANPSIIFIVLGVIVVVCHSGQPMDGEEYCERDVFEPSCADNEVILMKFALYGRMAIGKCIKQNYGHIGCKADVLSILDGFCSGRQSCTVTPNHVVLLDAKAKVCPSDFAAYLLTDQSCVQVQGGSEGDCQRKGFMPLSGDSGYIAVAHNINKLSQACAWRIDASQGRKVNITMMSFPPTPSATNNIPSSACYEVGSIKEGGKTKTIHKCLNDVRHKDIYFSNGGPVDITIPNRETLDVAGYFILHYQVVGCADPKVHQNADLQRTKQTAKIRCKSTSQQWELECKAGQWIGEAGQCTEENTGWSFLGIFDHEHPYGTAIVVGIGATIGVLAGGILLYILIAIFKRCQKSDYVMTYEYTDPNFAHIPTDYHADKSNLLIQDDKLFEQNSNTWGSQRQGNSNTLSRGGTDHSRVPLPPLPNECNTLSYEKPLYNRNGNI